MSEENPNSYEQKQIDRKERLENAADRAQGEANAAFQREHAIIDRIPMGQPILVGHHSEKRHRGDLKRAESARRKAFDAQDRAAELRGMASAVGTGGISSDDPDAIAKLEAELAGAHKWGEIVKVWNTKIRVEAKARTKRYGHELTHAEHRTLIEDLYLLSKTEGVTLGNDPAKVEMPAPIYKGLKSQAFAFPWLPKLGTDAANARRIEKRIEELKKRDADPEREPLEGEVQGLAFKLEDNKHANRVQIWFGAVPPEALREKLKSRGFKWSPSGGVWQRMRSNGAWSVARWIVGLS
jgi:hypothetical protein